MPWVYIPVQFAVNDLSSMISLKILDVTTSHTWRSWFGLQKELQEMFLRQRYWAAIVGSCWPLRLLWLSTLIWTTLSEGVIREFRLVDLRIKDVLAYRYCKLEFPRKIHPDKWCRRSNATLIGRRMILTCSSLNQPTSTNSTNNPWTPPATDNHASFSRDYGILFVKLEDEDEWRKSWCTRAEMGSYKSCIDSFEAECVDEMEISLLTCLIG